MTFRPPLYLQNSDLFSYSAADDRFLVDTLLAEGILNVSAGQGLVTQRPDGANMTVYVPPFDAIIKGDDGVLQGSYLLRMVAAESPVVTGAPATGSRIDLLVCEVIDSAYRSVNSAAPEGPRLRVIAGTAAASAPAVPALPPTAIPIASWPVAAGQTSITTASITDRRTPSTLASSSASLPVVTTTQRNLATPAVGRVAHNTDVRRPQFHDGATWRSIGAPVTGAGTLTLTISPTESEVSFFVGTGFSEVEFTIGNSPTDSTGATTSNNNNMVFRATVTPNAGEAAIFSAVTNIATSCVVLLSSTASAIIGGSGNGARNFRIDPDGFVRFIVARGTSGSVTFTYNYAWRAR